MIRFKTVEPGATEKPSVKPPAPVIVTPDAPEPAQDGEAEPKAKGLARKTPLRAKKPDAARLFRD